jgi:hypothetical protein
MRGRMGEWANGRGEKAGIIFLPIAVSPHRPFS